MPSPRLELVCSFLRCAAGMNGYAHHGGAQHASMKNITRLKNLQNRAVFMLDGFGAVHGLVEMRIKLFAERIDALDAEPGEVVHELLVDELEAFSIIFVFSFAMRSESMLETVNDGNHAFDDSSRVALGIVGALFFDALAVVVEVGLSAHQRLAQFNQVACELGDFRIGRDGILG